MTKLDRFHFIESGKCFYCNEYIEKEAASLDHLQAKSLGGSDHDDNLVLCCKEINSLLGNMSVKEKISKETSKHNHLSKSGKQKEQSMKANLYRLLTMCIEEGTETGIHRALRLSEKSDIEFHLTQNQFDILKDQIENEIMIKISEFFDF